MILFLRGWTAIIMSAVIMSAVMTRSMTAHKMKGPPEVDPMGLLARLKHSAVQWEIERLSATKSEQLQNST